MAGSGSSDNLSGNSSPSGKSIESYNDQKLARRSPRNHNRSLKNLLDNLVYKQRHNDEEEQDLID